MSERVTPVSFLDLLRRLDWRQELLGIALILAEASLLYLLTGFALAGDGPRYAVLPAWIIVGLLLIGHFVPHLLDEWRVWSPEYEAITGGAIVVSLLVAVKAGAFPHVAVWDTLWVRDAFHSLVLLDSQEARPVWGIVALTAWSWWRGRSREEPSIDSAYTMLRAGTALLAVLLIVILSASPQGSQVRDRLSVATVAYFAFTLSSIGVARLRLEGFRTSAPLGPRWLATFVAPILTVVLVAIVAAGIFSRQFLDTVLWALAPIFWFLAVVFQVFVIMMAVIAFLILTPIFWAIGTREPRAMQQTPTPAANQGFGDLQQRAEDAINVPDPIRYLIAALLLFLIFSALARFVFRRRRRTRDSTDEQRESVLDWSDVLGNAADRLRNLFRRREAEDPLAYLREDSRWRYTLRIREAYARLQERGAKAGRPRRAGETADEYEPAVGTRLATIPDVPSAVSALTARYDVARYSGIPATESDASAADHAWNTIARAPDSDE